MLCLFALVALVTVTCSTEQTPPVVVSVRDVVIDPYAVDGKLVRLVGLLHRTPEGDALYWNEADIRQAARSHAVSIQIAAPWPNDAEHLGTLVAVEGVFEADPVDCGSGFTGALLDGRSVEVR